MVPAANLIGFAGQELARKLPKVIGVVLETTLGSVVEIILFMVLLKTSRGDSNVPVIKAAILGSILANMLLCLGACFFAGGSFSCCGTLATARDRFDMRSTLILATFVALTAAAGSFKSPDKVKFCVGTGKGECTDDLEFTYNECTTLVESDKWGASGNGFYVASQDLFL